MSILKFEKSGSPFYVYHQCYLKKIVDGDTIDVDLEVDIGFYQKHIIGNQRVRLAGIDTAEVVGNSKAKGLAAKKFVEDTLLVWQKKEISGFSIITSRSDKYGRYLGIVVPRTKHSDSSLVRTTSVTLAGAPHWLDSLNLMMIQHGHATEYWGGKK